MRTPYTSINVEVFRPFLVRSGQQEGLSVINPDMVDGIGFSTGGFEAKYGDKMSSALDITYKRPKKTEASVSASLLGASAYLGLATRSLLGPMVCAIRPIVTSLDHSKQRENTVHRS